jgi:hypothetical protein
MRDFSIFKFCVEDDVISTVVGPLLDLKSLFMLYVCNTKLNKNYRPFIALLLQKENAASRMGRVCLRERRRRRKLNPSAPKTLWIHMNHKKQFQNFNPSSYFRIEVETSCGEGSKTSFYSTEIHIRLPPDDTFIFVGMWCCMHLAQHVRFFEIEPDVEIPAYIGEGEDPQVRIFTQVWCVVLDLNGRQWVGQSMGTTLKSKLDFRFHRTSKGEAHALLLASDLVEQMCGFAPHAELGIDGMA